MRETLGRSVYLSETDEHTLSEAGIANSPVFLSLHRQEEMKDGWRQRMISFCEQLYRQNCRILADISKRTFAAMEVSSLEELRDLLHLHSVRIDYGFTIDEIKEAAQIMPVVLNASTITEAEMKEFAGCELSAMHNFYPRPETGLDKDYVRERTDLLHQYGFTVSAFIAGTGNRRGPLYEGLPTLEEHRHAVPLYACADLIRTCGVDQVYAGDPEVEESELKRIERFLQEDVLELPCTLTEGCEDLYGRVFTNRIDSPAGLIRIAESREYSVASGRRAKPENTAERARGTITMDNEAYLRYEGEIMIAKRDYPSDPRVNVIGRIENAYMPVIDLIDRGDRLMFVRPQ